jgi:hypothetical protein
MRAIAAMMQLLQSAMAPVKRDMGNHLHNADEEACHDGDFLGFPHVQVPDSYNLLLEKWGAVDG